MQLRNPTNSANQDVSDDKVEFEDQIEGLVYCDYTIPKFECKPDAGFYHKVIYSCRFSQSNNANCRAPYQALIQANVTDASKCLFVDDNRGNVDAAKKEGWGRCVHFHEAELQSAVSSSVEDTGIKRNSGDAENDVAVISNLEELRVLWPDIFKKNI